MRKVDAIIPLTYFKKNSDLVCTDVQHNQKVIILTRHGEGVLVLQNIPSYQLMVELAEDTIHQAALARTMESSMNKSIQGETDDRFELVKRIDS